MDYPVETKVITLPSARRAGEPEPVAAPEVAEVDR
jgi:hypothetical protein